LSAKAPGKTKRDLSAIFDDIDRVLQSDTANSIRLGYLLLEAHKQVDHGEWLPLLKKRFDFSERSARHYMAAAKYDRVTSPKLAELGIRSATVADLKIAPTVLYELASGRRDFYSEEDEATILKSAQTERVDADRAYEIHIAGIREQPSQWTESSGEEEAEAEPLAASQNETKDDAGDQAEAEAEPEPEASAEKRKAEYAEADDKNDAGSESEEPRRSHPRNASQRLKLFLRACYHFLPDLDPRELEKAEEIFKQCAKEARKRAAKRAAA
jgi:hypothetical protein